MQSVCVAPAQLFERELNRGAVHRIARYGVTVYDKNREPTVKGASSEVRLVGKGLCTFNGSPLVTPTKDRVVVFSAPPLLMGDALDAYMCGTHLV